MKTTHIYQHHGQMSESFLTAMFLSMSGGLQDAYTYLSRGKVFANAQTGNIVLLSTRLVEHNWAAALRYLVPLLAFALGVFAAELLHEYARGYQRLHWRQIVILVEIVILFLVGFIPEELNLIANALVSFSCAMQVQSFRKVSGYVFASTMCIGNLRSGTEALSTWILHRDAQNLRRLWHYLGIIVLFGLGAALGSLGVKHLGSISIWGSCALLLICFGLMFIPAQTTPNVQENDKNRTDK